MKLRQFFSNAVNNDNAPTETDLPQCEFVFDERKQILEVELEDRTETYNKLNAMIDYLKVYRSDFQCRRLPKYELKF